MSSNLEKIGNLRDEIRWNHIYGREWDATPDAYSNRGIVAAGKSRRLGVLRRGVQKAYLGVQCVDPVRAGWETMDRPAARFFLSYFVAGKTVTLRTFDVMDDALVFLAQCLAGAHGS